MNGCESGVTSPDPVPRIPWPVWPFGTARHGNEPPPLGAEYTIPEFYHFMRQEVYCYSPAYTRHRVVIHNADRLSRLASQSGAVLAFIHYGSFLLSGGAIVHQLGLPYAAMGSRRNLIPQMMSEDDIAYWLDAHQRAAELYGNPLLYSDESAARKALRWLQKGHLLGMALDVREYGHRHKEARFSFLGATLYMQYGPVRVARIAGVPILPMTIQFDAVSRMHHLEIGAPVDETVGSEPAMQCLLDALAQGPAERPQQLFHDIVEAFRVPHNPFNGLFSEMGP
jgi:lauroyl/myristoyl acyltransferase